MFSGVCISSKEWEDRRSYFPLSYEIWHCKIDLKPRITIRHLFKLFLQGDIFMSGILRISGTKTGEKQYQFSSLKKKLFFCFFIDTRAETKGEKNILREAWTIGNINEIIYYIVIQIPRNSDLTLSLERSITKEKAVVALLHYCEETTMWTFSWTSFRGWDEVKLQRASQIWQSLYPKPREMLIAIVIYLWLEELSKKLSASVYIYKYLWWCSSPLTIRRD